MERPAAAVFSAKREALEQVVRCAVRAGMLTAWRDARGRTPHEPDFVGHLILQAVPAIDRGWRAALGSAIGLEVVGVFCHQRPYVRFQRPARGEGRCELGDLLLGHVHTTLDGRRSQRALLLQAKLVRKHPASVPIPLDAQLDLYFGWPRFAYDSPPLRGQSRQLRGGAPHPGAQYLLVEGDHDALLHGAGEPMRVARPGQTLRAGPGLPAAFVDVLLGAAGAPSGLADAQEDDWPRVVRDLLYASLDHAFSRNRSGVARRPRVTGSARALDGMLLLGQERGRGAWVLARDADDPHEPEGDGEPDSSGVPLLLVQTWEKERPAQG